MRLGLLGTILNVRTPHTSTFMVIRVVNLQWPRHASKIKEKPETRGKIWVSQSAGEWECFLCGRGCLEIRARASANIREQQVVQQPKKHDHLQDSGQLDQFIKRKSYRRFISVAAGRHPIARVQRVLKFVQIVWLICISIAFEWPSLKCQN